MVSWSATRLQSRGRRGAALLVLSFRLPESLSTVRVLWSQQTDAPLRGLVLVRERNWALTWNAANWLYLFNAKGERQAQVHMRGQQSIAAACADDGLSFAAVTAEGRVLL